MSQAVLTNSVYENAAHMLRRTGSMDPSPRAIGVFNYSHIKGY